MAAADLTNLSLVKGVMTSPTISSGNSYIFSHNTATGNETWLVKSLILTNATTTSTDVQVSVSINTAGVPVPFEDRIIHEVWIPRATNLVVIDGLIPIYLQYQHYIQIFNLQGDSLRAVIKHERLRE